MILVCVEFAVGRQFAMNTPVSRQPAHLTRLCCFAEAAAELQQSLFAILECSGEAGERRGGVADAYDWSRRGVARGRPPARTTRRECVNVSVCVSMSVDAAPRAVPSCFTLQILPFYSLPRAVQKRTLTHVRTPTHSH